MEAVASTDHTINIKENEEMEKYQDLAQELRKAQNMDIKIVLITLLEPC